MTLYTLQLLRFIAALLVLFFHLNLIDSGYKGVDVFFVISGFVMYYTLFSKTRPTTFKFITNRLSKIFFLYWIALILLYVTAPYTIDLSFLKTFLLIPGHNSALGISWSLSYELYFYFLIGTVVYLTPNKYHKSIFFFTLITSILISFANLTSFSLKGSAVNFLLGPNLLEFLLGIASAFLSAAYYKTINPAIVLTAALVICVLLLAISIPYASPGSYIIYGILSFALISCITSYEKRITLNKKSTELFKVLGDASYAIYLFGPIVAIAVTADTNLSKVLIIFITISFSILFNQIVENNFLGWIRKVI